MTFVALVGAISHISMGAKLEALPMAVVVALSLIGAIISSKFANKCDIEKLNRVIGCVLLVLGIFTIITKLLA